MTKPWLSEHSGTPEVNVGDAPTFRVCCGTNQQIEIDKLYGPLCAELVRITLQREGEVADWVVERLNQTTERWEEKARWHCQESYPEDEESQEETP